MARMVSSIVYLGNIRIRNVYSFLSGEGYYSGDFLFSQPVGSGLVSHLHCRICSVIEPRRLPFKVRTSSVRRVQGFSRDATRVATGHIAHWPSRVPDTPAVLPKELTAFLNRVESIRAGPNRRVCPFSDYTHVQKDRDYHRI
jgi:hypothetical protein